MYNIIGIFGNATGADPLIFTVSAMTAAPRNFSFSSKLVSEHEPDLVFLLAMNHFQSNRQLVCFISKNCYKTNLSKSARAPEHESSFTFIVRRTTSGKIIFEPRFQLFLKTGIKKILKNMLNSPSEGKNGYIICFLVGRLISG